MLISCQNNETQNGEDHLRTAVGYQHRVSDMGSIRMWERASSVKHIPETRKTNDYLFDFQTVSRIKTVERQPMMISPFLARVIATLI